MTQKKVRETIKDSVILITGGTGSFGNTVAKHLIHLQPKKIIIFSRDEKKQFDMRNAFDNPLLKFVIGDVRNYESINNALRGVDYVFHAAALKQVPTCEFFPMEAVHTNIIGANNVVRAAIARKVKRVVVLSTDKAVYPINAIGLSKAMMEKTMIAEAKKASADEITTILSGVRYGNVLYTRGSVLPYFVELMKQHKKIPVTNYQMTRYLLPLPKAVDLVLYALVNGKSGHIYVRKSPATNLETIAKALIKLFGYKQGYYEVGIRAGEKMHETLITQEEIIRAKDVGDYYDIPPESQGLDYNKYFYRGDRATLSHARPYTSKNAVQLNLRQTSLLFSQIPEIQKELERLKK